MQRSLSITLSGIKTQLSYLCLAINVPRSESTDLAIATDISERRSDWEDTIGYLLQVLPAGKKIVTVCQIRRI